MLRLFKSSNGSLKQQYDALRKEAYALSKVNPEESLRKQQEAQRLRRQMSGAS